MNNLDRVAADIEPSGAPPNAAAGQSTAAFLKNVNSKLEAGLYEAMLRKNGVDVIGESQRPAGAAAMMSAAAGEKDAVPVNLYVPESQLERARALVDAFENDPIVYKGPPPRLHQVSRIRQVIYTLCIFFLMVVPLGAAAIYLLYRLFKFLFPG